MDERTKKRSDNKGRDYYREQQAEQRALGARPAGLASAAMKKLSDLSRALGTRVRWTKTESTKGESRRDRHRAEARSRRLREHHRNWERLAARAEQAITDHTAARVRRRTARVARRAISDVIDRKIHKETGEVPTRRRQRLIDEEGRK